ncbi:MAG: peroxiredoxin family protein [Chloroflexota bacterium]
MRPCKEDRAMSPLWMASYLVLWVIVAGLAIIMIGLLRQIGLFAQRLGPDPGALITQEGLNRGTEAPDFEITDIHTQRTSRLSAFRGHRVLLVFLAPDCSSCRTLAPHLEEVAREQAGNVATLVVCHGDGATCAEFARQEGLRQSVLADPGNEVAERYEVPASPFAFLLDSSGTILIRGVVNSWTQLEALIMEEGTFQKHPWKPITATIVAESANPSKAEPRTASPLARSGQTVMPGDKAGR